MTHNYRRVAAKQLINVVIAFSSGVVGTGPAGADPSAFGALSCRSCQETAPPGSQVRRNEIASGIAQSLAASQPGRPHTPS